MQRTRSGANQTGTKGWFFHWLAPRCAGKNSNESWWAREDSNLQPDRYERSALTIELRARCAQAQAAPRAPHTMPRRERQSRPARTADAQNYILKSRLALALKILILSSSHSGTVCIHCTAGLLATKGQSTANRILSMPISITQHNSAGLEKLPLVVM